MVILEWGSRSSALTTHSKTQQEMSLQIAFAVDTTTESQTENRKVPVLLKGMSSKDTVPEIEKRNIAGALCARDYKGFNNFG